jgi:hypothetical protein
MWEPRCLTTLWASTVRYRVGFTFATIFKSSGAAMKRWLDDAVVWVQDFCNRFVEEVWLVFLTGSRSNGPKESHAAHEPQFCLVCYVTSDGGNDIFKMRFGMVVELSGHVLMRELSRHLPRNVEEYHKEVQNIQRPNGNSNRALLEYKFETLQLRQFARASSLVEVCLPVDKATGAWTWSVNTVYCRG